MELTKARRKEYRKANAAQIAARKRKESLARRGWSVEEFDAAFVAQDGKCAICLAEPKPGDVLQADHCHVTSKRRGLLCRKCNWREEPILTRFMTDPDFRAKWEAYLAP